MRQNKPCIRIKKLKREVTTVATGSQSCAKLLIKRKYLTSYITQTYLCSQLSRQHLRISKDTLTSTNKGGSRRRKKVVNAN